MNTNNPYMSPRDADLLIEKWKPLLDAEGSDVKPLTTRHERLVTAVVLENELKHLREANITGDGGAWGASLQGTPGQGGAVPGGSDFYASGDARLPKVLIPMIRRTFPELITNEIVGVQPMTGPVGLAFALRYRQGAESLVNGPSCSDSHLSACGAEAWWKTTTAAGSTGDAEIGWNYLNTAWTGASTSALSGTSAFEIPANDMGVARIVQAFEMTGKIPTMEIGFEKTAVEAGTRRLAARWSVELEQDLRNMNGIDIDSEMTNTMSYEIQADIDREMIIRMIKTCLNAGADKGYSFWDATTADARWIGERSRDFYAKLIVEANRIAVRNRRGAANFVIATPRVCAMLEMLPEFKFMPVNSTVNTQPVGIAKVGSVGGRFNVYRDTRTEAQQPYMTGVRTTAIEYAMLGYKGPEFYDTGIVYCPYIPVMIQRTIGPNDFSPRVGLMTRYGVVDNLFGAALYYHLVIVQNLGEAFVPGASARYL